MDNIFEIDSLGHLGDGIAQTSDGKVYVPFTLAGEQVEAQGKSAHKNLVSVKSPSPDRIEPICNYYQKCGGCQMQHASDAVYSDWKQQLVASGLSGLQGAVQPDVMMKFEGGLRRRVVFTASHTKDGVDLGFVEKSTHNIVVIENCPVVCAEISSQIETIKKIVRSILPAKGNSSIHVLACENGLDILVEGSGTPNEKGRQIAIRCALEAGIARLSFGNETLIERKHPVLSMGSAMVSPPAGAFVQAMREAETAMADLVCNHLKGCKKVADLYCGAGTFALRLAERSTVFACESDQGSLDSLDEAWRGTGGKLKAIRVEKRDLSLRPVMVGELKKIQGVVFDPPRAGAEAQAKQLAGSAVRKIAAVSCNPETLARDLEILIRGGFKLEKIIPIDQFVYTPHIEVVALLTR